MFPQSKGNKNDGKCHEEPEIVANRRQVSSKKNKSLIIAPALVTFGNEVT